MKELDLVEAEADALDCARLNITDARARFHWADATAIRPTKLWDAVVMNPPFYGTHYARHVEHALRYLHPNGVLTAILPATARYDHGLLSGSWEDLPVGAFSASGTNVNTVILTLAIPRGQVALAAGTCDPDATAYWLARMLEAGEDPRFVARRIVICASEDVGLADSNALVVAEAAFRAVEHIGMPEARIPLAHAALYVALAPKSNSAWLAIDKATTAVREKPAYAVPPHLRGTGYKGAEKLGHGVDYKYAHNYPGHWVEQQYLPKELIGERFFERGEKDPANRGKGDK